MRMRRFKQQFISQNRSYKKFNPIGVVLHETATPGASAQDEYRYFNKPDRKVSCHAFVDWDEDLQFIPWDEIAWHCKPSGNKRFIGLEMCRPSNTDKFKKDKMEFTYKVSVNAVARLFKFVLKIDKVTKDNLMSHHEVSLKWKESTHVDPTSYLKDIKKDMDMFRKDVQSVLDKGVF